MSSVMEIAMKDMGQLIELANANLKYLPGPILNVQGFGATADGETDVTEIVQSVIDQAILEGQKAIFFPHGDTGQYYVTALTNADQVVLFGDNASFVGGYIGTILQLGEGGITQAEFDALQTELDTLEADYAKQVGKVFNVGGYGAVGDWNGTTGTDDTVAIKAAISAAEAAGGGVVYAPKKYRITSALTLKEGTIIQGEGISNSALIKDYVESTPTNAFVVMDVTNNSGGLRGISLYAAQAGGAGVSLIATATDAPDFIVLDHVYITGGALWNHTIYVDGSLRTSAPQGVRDLKILNCDLFNASSSIVTLKGYNNVNIDNTGMYGTGPADNFDIQGAAGFASNNLSANLVTCVTVNLALSGTVNQTVIRCPIITNFNNGSGAFNVVIIGRVTNKQENWANGIYVDSNGSVLYGGVLNRGGGDFTSEKASTTKSANAGYSGAHKTTSVATTKTFTFTTSGSSKTFSIFVGGGQGALFHCDNASGTITILSNPSGLFENSATPTAGKIGVFKSASSHIISVKNNVASTSVISLFVNGLTVTDITDPV